MDTKVTAMLALIFLIVLIIIVVVGLSYNPAPAEIIMRVPEKSAADLLMEKTRTRSLPNNSSMTPSNRNQLSPASIASSTNSPWEVLDKMREERKGRDVRQQAGI